MSKQNVLHDISLAYAKSLPLWKQHLSSCGSQIEELLDGQLLHATVKTRVKTLESLSEKRGFLARSTGDPNPVIKDLLGMRIVVPFHEESRKGGQPATRAFPDRGNRAQVGEADVS